MISAWRESPLLAPLAEMGDKLKAGYEAGHRFGLQDFPGGTYPACSRHGAMQRVSAELDWWRCVEPGCNIGCEWRRPPEEWRPAAGWEGYYEVSSRGKTRRAGDDRTMKPHAIAMGPYPGVAFSRGNRRVNIRIATLVAATFLGPKPPNHEINHIDGHHRNNCVENLEYVVHDANEKHAARNRLKAWGTRHAMSKLTEAEVREIRSLRGKETWADLAARFHVSKTAIGNVLSGRTWRHLDERDIR